MSPVWRSWQRSWLIAGTLVIALLVAIVLVAGIWAATRDQPHTPTPETVSPASSATVSPAAQSPDSGTATTESATAVSSPVDASLPAVGSLPWFLRLAPDRLANDSLPLPFVASYADISGWMAQQGIARPSGLTDPALGRWERQVGALSLPTSLATRGTEEIWQTTYGFDLTQVDQVLMVGSAPDSVMILTGAFDPTALQNSWVSSGYQAVKIEGMTIWSLYPGDIIDLSSPASRPALGSLNNVVLLEDGTLVAAAKLSRLQSVLKVLNGNQQSLAANADIQRLLSPIDEVEQLVSAVIEKGELLETVVPSGDAGSGTDAPSPVADETKTPVSASIDASASRMPKVKLTLLGLRGAGEMGSLATPASPVVATPRPANGADRYEMVMVLLFDDEDAAPVAERAMHDRLARGHSTVTNVAFSDRLASPHFQTSSVQDWSVLVLHAQLVQGPADWVRIVETRDLEFAFWVRSP